MMPEKTKVAALLLLACVALARAQEPSHPKEQPPAQSGAPSTTAAQPAPVPAPASAPGPGVGPYDDETIQLAIKETLAEKNQIKQTRPDYLQTLHGNQYDRFSDAFSSAKVPDCLHEDALRLEPPHIGPIVLTQLLGLPFLVAAKLNGKCL